MSLPLVAVPTRHRSSLFDSAIEARRDLCVLEAPGTSPSLNEVVTARQRVLAQLSSVSSCIETMAEMGLLHTGLDVRHTMSTRAHQVEREGVWVAETIVTRVPPRPLIAARWTPEFCSAVMTASVVLNVVACDHRRELVEYRQLATVLFDAWPEIDARLETHFVDEWLRSDDQDDNLSGTPRNGVASGPSPWGKAVRLVHNALRDGARGCHPPVQVEAGAIHALDFARRTLQWVNVSASSLDEEACT